MDVSLKKILLKIHLALATIAMNSNVYSTGLVDEVNTLLEDIHRYCENVEEDKLKLQNDR